MALGALLSVFSLSSCSTSSNTLVDEAEAGRAWWNGDAVEGTPRIVIDLSKQRLQYFKSGKLVGVSPISSGRESTATVNGRFKIIEKDIDHRSSLFGAYVNEAGEVVQDDVETRTDPCPTGARFIGARMRYFMRIVGGIGMHEGYLPGYPASHGCIRLPTKMAAIFFHATPLGTPVEIVGQGELAVNEAPIPIRDEELQHAPPAVEEQKIAETQDSVESKPSSDEKTKPAKSARFVFFGRRQADSETADVKLASASVERRVVVDETESGGSGRITVIPQRSSSSVPVQQVQASHSRSSSSGVSSSGVSSKPATSFFKFKRRPPPGTTLYLEGY